MGMLVGATEARLDQQPDAAADRDLQAAAKNYLDDRASGETATAEASSGHTFNNNLHRKPSA